MPAEVVSRLDTFAKIVRRTLEPVAGLLVALRQALEVGDDGLTLAILEQPLDETVLQREKVDR